MHNWMLFFGCFTLAVTAEVMLKMSYALSVAKRRSVRQAFATSSDHYPLKQVLLTAKIVRAIAAVVFMAVFFSILRSMV